MNRSIVMATALTVAWSMPIAAQTKDANAEFEKFRAEMEESNPAELFELKGEELWKAKRGPKNVSLAESCDLGQGVGKVEGAYVRAPRYFADADAVMDIERRIVWCMTEKQGVKFEDIAKKPFQGANDNNAVFVVGCPSPGTANVLDSVNCVLVASVASIDAGPSFTVRPSADGSELMVFMGASVSGSVSFSVFAADGALVLQQNVPGQANASWSFSTADRHGQLLFLQANSAKGSFTRRVVVP